MCKSPLFMTIGERIIFVLNRTQKEIGEYFGVSQDTISLWKLGKSKPNFEQLSWLCEETYVDYEWLYNGKTENITALIYAFFPIYYKRNSILNEDSYCFARLMCGYALANKYDKSIYIDAIAASAVFFRHATNKNIPNPREIVNKNGLIFPYSIDDNVPIPLKSIQAIANIPLPHGYLDKFKTKIITIEESYIEFQNYNLPQPKSSSTPQILQIPSVAPEDFQEIPFYPDEIAAGQPLEVRDDPEGIVIVHKDWCKQPENTVAVRVSSTGTSMEPTIPAGAIVTIDTTPTEPDKLLGQAVAIYKKDDGATIKRLAQTTKGWCGIPDNRDPKHQVIMIEDGDRIIGKVNSVHYAL